MVPRDEALAISTKVLIIVLDPVLLDCHLSNNTASALSGAKVSVSWFKSNLVIVSPPVIQPARVASPRTPLQMPSSAAPLEYTKVSIFDTANKFIAYSGNFSQGVRTVTSEWGAVFVLGMDGKVS